MSRPAQPPRGLPAYFCRECGHSGWLAMMHDGDHHLTDDPRSIYQAYFDRSQQRALRLPRRLGEDHRSDAGEQLCPHCLACGLRSAYARLPGGHPSRGCATIERPTPGRRSTRAICSAAPSAPADDALSIVGSQAASLSRSRSAISSPARSTTTRSCWPSPTRCRTPRTGPPSSGRAPTASACVRHPGRARHARPAGAAERVH